MALDSNYGGLFDWNGAWFSDPHDNSVLNIAGYYWRGDRAQFSLDYRGQFSGDYDEQYIGARASVRF